MAEMTDMRKDVDWYYANLDSLLPINNDKYLAIADGQLLGDFDECIDGVRAMEGAGRKSGTYIVHKCIPLEQERREWYYRSNHVRFGGMDVIRLGDFSVTNLTNTVFSFRIPSEGSSPMQNEHCIGARDSA